MMEGNARVMVSLRERIKLHVPGYKGRSVRKYEENVSNVYETFVTQ